MNRRRLVVLVCAVLALIAATVWLPVVPRDSYRLRATAAGRPGYRTWERVGRSSLVEWERIDAVVSGRNPGAQRYWTRGVAPVRVPDGATVWKDGPPQVRWGLLALTDLLILVAGVLLAWRFGRDAAGEGGGRQ